VAAGNRSVVDVDLQRLSESSGGDCQPDAPLRDVTIPEPRPDGSLGEQ
jgi:hypothetical protein